MQNQVEQQATPIKQLMQQRDSSSEFAQLPAGADQVARPVISQQPSGQGQGVTAPEGSKREFFTMIKEIDIRNVVLVFALLMFFSTSLFPGLIKGSVGAAVDPTGKATILGSFLSALLGTLIYIIVKLIGKF